MSADVNCPLLSRVTQNARKTAICSTARQSISAVKNSSFLFSKEKASNSPVIVTSPCFKTVLRNQQYLGSCNYTIGNNTPTVKVQPDTPTSKVQWFPSSIILKTSHGSSKCFCLESLSLLRSQGVSWTFYLVHCKYQVAASLFHSRNTSWNWWEMLEDLHTTSLLSNSYQEQHSLTSHPLIIILSSEEEDKEGRHFTHSNTWKLRHKMASQFVPVHTAPVHPSSGFGH